MIEAVSLAFILAGLMGEKRMSNNNIQEAII
jgi:hypothetical protein